MNLMKSSPESAVKFAVFERAQEFLMSRARNSGQVKGEKEAWKQSIFFFFLFYDSHSF